MLKICAVNIKNYFFVTVNIAIPTAKGNKEFNLEVIPLQELS